jgi:hypothetical protein
MPAENTPENGPKAQAGAETGQALAYAQSMGSSIASVSSVEFKSTNETGRAIAGGVLSFSALVKGADAQGASVQEEYRDVQAGPAPWLIALQPGSYAIDSSAPMGKAEIAVRFCGLEKAFAYEILSQDTASAGSLILVNRYTKDLGESYVPPGLVDTGFVLRKEAGEAAQKMIAEASAAGVGFYVTSAYRSYSLQKTLFERANKQEGTDQRSSAPPGQSEHQAGVAVDLTCAELNGSLLERFDQTAAFGWLQENAARFGFILRYGKANTALTGYIYEPWHYRYVGVDTAQTYIKEGWESLDEFLCIPR